MKLKFEDDKPALTIELLKAEAKTFCERESTFGNTALFGTTDGKAIGTYIEQKFQAELAEKYTVEIGSSAKGVDFPDAHINTDVKVTSIRQPQSSSPFRNAQQKIFGLGYNLLVFVYDKSDNQETGEAILNFKSCAFIDKTRTADFTTTKRIREMVDDEANDEDIIAYLNDKNIPADDITLSNIAEQVLAEKPHQGYLTISNALQWRLQYKRIVTLTDTVEGITKMVDNVTNQ